MNYTENLSLGLPEYGEDADVADLNRNSGILDAYVYNTRQIECEPYDSTKTYMSGDLAIHNEVIYECNTDNTTGTWDDSKWDSTTLAEQIAKAKQMGGESALADLDDVEITNPSTGQALLFDDSDDKWKNQNLPDVSVTKEASGNPIELTDAANAPLVKCITAITGSQDLHGYDKPWVGGSGKNKLPLNLTYIKSKNTVGTWSNNAYILNGVTFTVLEDESDNVIGVKVNGQASADAILTLYSDLRDVLAEGTSITVNGTPTGGTSSSYRMYAYTVGYEYGNGVTGTIPASQCACGISIINGYNAQNLMFYPMVRLSTETDPTFVPYSNICPITAYTEGEIEVRGKNLVKQIVRGYINSSTNAIRIDGDSETVLIKVEQGEAYTFSAGVTTNRNMIGYVGVDELVNGTPVTNIKTLSSYTWRAEWSGWTAWYINATASADVEATAQVEKGGTATPYEPYTSTTHTTTYPSAIYRGSEDVVNGEVNADKIKLTITSGIQLYGTFGTDDALLFYYELNINVATYSRVLHPIDNKIISNFYNAITTENENDMHDFEIRTNNNAMMVSDRIYFRDSRFATALAFNQYVANNPIEVVVKLATPTTSSAIPTNLPIKSLSGYNHIESSTGDMEVEYITSEYQPLVDLIQSSKHVYSTQEQIVGTWVDGSTLYERTIYISDTLVMESPNTWIDSGVDISYVDKFVSFNATMYDGSGVPALWCGKANNHLTLLSSRGNTFNGLCVVLRYTKSTATRSLSAPLTSQKAKIEPLSEKEEEVPTEEEKAVNEEENTNER